MFRSLDLIVAGGGLVGSITAIAAAREGMSVALIDPVPTGPEELQGFDGRAYAISQSSLNLLQSLELISEIRDSMQEIEGIRILDGRPGGSSWPSELTFNASDIDRRPMAKMVEDRHLRRAVLSKVRATPGILHVTGSPIVEVSVNGRFAEARCKNGEHYAATALAGCDGHKSLVAENSGIAHQTKDYGQSAIVCAIGHDRPHEGIAFQAFMPDGPLAVLPLAGKLSSIVWTVSSDFCRWVLQLPEDGFLNELASRIGNRLGKLSLAGPRFAHALSLSLAERLVAPRIALVGDAAHRLHPLAGQGMNLGMREAASLVEVLAEARRRGEDIGDILVLNRYQRWCRFDVASLAATTDGCNWLYSNDSEFLKAARVAGHRIIDKLPRFKRFLIMQAAGMNGSLPAAMAERRD